VFVFNLCGVSDTALLAGRGSLDIGRDFTVPTLFPSTYMAGAGFLAC